MFPFAAEPANSWQHILGVCMLGLVVAHYNVFQEPTLLLQFSQALLLGDFYPAVIGLLELNGLL